MNKTIPKVFILLGIISLSFGAVFLVSNYLSIDKNDENSIEQDNEEQEKLKEEKRKNEKDCLNDYVTGNFNKITISNQDKEITIDFLNSINEVSTDDGKRYESGEAKFILNLFIREDAIENYSSGIYQSFIEKDNAKFSEIKNNSVKKEDELEYKVVSFIEKNDKEEVLSEIYNILYRIDEMSFLQVEITYNDGRLEDEFFYNIVKSIKIVNK